MDGGVMDTGVNGFTDKNYENSTVCSEVPEMAKNEPCCLGIDEAGRGPVLGPMVYGICYCPISLKEELVQMGFADSKTLTEEQRENLMKKIEEASEKLGWIIEILSPNYLSNAMLRRHKYNLNAVSHDTAIGLIKRAIESGVQLKEVFVDTVGPPEKYQDKLKGIFPDLDITVTKKADSLFPIVSAASICAKVGRDWAVQRWKFEKGLQEGDESIEYGSGYPSDPKTKKFMANTLDNVFGFPQFVRFSWSTAGNLLDSKAAVVSWEDDDEEEDKTTPSITSFFSGKGGKAKELPQSQFFQDYNLKLVSDF